MMDDLRRFLENTTILLVVILSAPLAALLVAIFLIYLCILFVPSAAGGTSELRDFFAMIYVVIYLTICFFTVKGS